MLELQTLDCIDKKLTSEEKITFLIIELLKNYIKLYKKYDFLEVVLNQGARG